MLEDGDGASGAMSAGSTEGPAPRPRDDKAAAQCASRRSARHGTLILVALGALVLASTLASLMLGRYPITPIEAVGMLANLALPIDSFWTSQQETLFFQVRLPRIALALMVGCSLATAGAAYQGTFQNPLVSPDILGASQGAAFGAAVAILLGLGSLGISLFAFACSIAAVLLVLAVGTRAKGNHLLIVVLAGVMVSSLFQAGVSFTKLIADPTDQLAAITYWLMGSLSGTRLADVARIAPAMAAGLLPLFLLRWKLNLLTLGDDEARAMGVNAPRLRFLTVVCATLVTAASIAVSGMIGWVGLVVPHLCRKLVGSNFRVLLPCSMLAGAAFLLLVDNLSRNLLATEIPIGILTAFTGAPFFLYLMLRKGGAR